MTRLLSCACCVSSIVLSALAHHQENGSSPPATTQGAIARPSEVRERLDIPIAQLEMKDEKVTDVLGKLQEETRVEINRSEATLRKLPNGDETRLANVSVQNSTLGDALDKVLFPLGLEYRLEEDTIVVSPTAPLRRMERANWAELNLLQRLRSTPYSADEFAKLKIQYRIPSRMDGPGLLTDQLTRAGQGTIAEMLETATGSLGWTWLPEGDHIAIITKEAAVSRALSRKTTKSFPEQHLGTILFDLGREADIVVTFQPGTFRKTLLSDLDAYHISIRNSSIKDAFEQIKADTGLNYRITADGVNFGPAEDIDMSKLTAENGEGDPFVVKVSMPLGDKGSVDFLFRESELPPSVLNYRERNKQALIQQVRRATQTQPAAATAPVNRSEKSGGTPNERPTS